MGISYAPSIGRPMLTHLLKPESVSPHPSPQPTERGRSCMIGMWRRKERVWTVCPVPGGTVPGCESNGCHWLYASKRRIQPQILTGSTRNTRDPFDKIIIVKPP